MIQSAPSLSSYRSEIDGLRAFAVLSVVVFHAFPGSLEGGFVGVDVFFVISGFLITGHIFENLDKNEFSFIDFFGRRIRRIFPALTLVMACSLGFGWFLLYQDEFAQLGKHVASGSIFITNFVLVEESGYFDNVAETKPMLHLWSLAVEEQFYILCPLVLWFARKVAFNLFGITLIFFAASLLWNLSYVRLHPVEMFFYPFGRFWELLSGSILAWLNLRRPHLFLFSESISNLLSLGGLLLLFFSISFLSEEFDFPSYWAAVPVLGTLLVLAAGSRGLVARRLLANPVAVWFGLISYPLYLWHWPILSFLQIVEGDIPEEKIRIVAVLVSIALAWLTYAVVEKSIRKRKVSGKLSLTLFSFIGCLGVLGFAISSGMVKPYSSFLEESGLSEGRATLPFDFPVSDGFSGRPEAQERSERDRCFDLLGISQESKIRYCQVGDVSRSPQVALIGDSHSAAAFEGVSYYFGRDHDLSVVNLAGRLFSNVVNAPEGDDRERDVYLGGFEVAEYLDAHKDIETIIMVSRGFFYLDWAENFSIPGRDIESKEAVYIEGIRDLLDRFSDRNVIFVLENPTLNFDPRSCASRRPLKPFSFYLDAGLGGAERCSVSRIEDGRLHSLYIQMVSQLLEQYPNVVVVDPRDVLCDAEACFSEIGGRVVYSDRSHLNRNGSYVQGRQISEAYNAFAQ